MRTIYDRVTDRIGPVLPWVIAVLAACGFAYASAAHADEQTITTSTAADLR